MRVKRRVIGPSGRGSTVRRAAVKHRGAAGAVRARHRRETDVEIVGARAPRRAGTRSRPRSAGQPRHSFATARGRRRARRLRRRSRRRRSCRRCTAAPARSRCRRSRPRNVRRRGRQPPCAPARRARARGRGAGRLADVAGGLPVAAARMLAGVDELMQPRVHARQLLGHVETLRADAGLIGAGCAGERVVGMQTEIAVALVRHERLGPVVPDVGVAEHERDRQRSAARRFAVAAAAAKREPHACDSALDELAAVGCKRQRSVAGARILFGFLCRSKAGDDRAARPARPART